MESYDTIAKAPLTGWTDVGTRCSLDEVIQSRIDFLLCHSVSSFIAEPEITTYVHHLTDSIAQWDLWVNRLFQIRFHRRNSSLPSVAAFYERTQLKFIPPCSTTTKTSSSTYIYIYTRHVDRSQQWKRAPNQRIEVDVKNVWSTKERVWPSVSRRKTWTQIKSCLEEGFPAQLNAELSYGDAELYRPISRLDRLELKREKGS